MKRKIIVMGLLSCLLLAACGRQNVSEDTGISGNKNIEDGEGNKIEIKDTIDTVPKMKSFADPFADGNLLYTVESCISYTNLNDAGIEKDMLIEPHNTYFSQDTGEKYQTVSDFVNDDGSIVDTHEFIVLELKIENEDAVGAIKKTEFTVSGIALRGGENVSQYNAAYFSEAGKTDSSQPLHYNLGQEESLEVKIGYFVLKEDLKNLVGVISDSDVQFSVRE
jgi:hypothetical protein